MFLTLLKLLFLKVSKSREPLPFFSFPANFSAFILLLYYFYVLVSELVWLLLFSWPWIRPQSHQVYFVTQMMTLSRVALICSSSGQRLTFGFVEVEV